MLNIKQRIIELDHKNAGIPDIARILDVSSSIVMQTLNEVYSYDNTRKKYINSSDKRRNRKKKISSLKPKSLEGRGKEYQSKNKGIGGVKI